MMLSGIRIGVVGTRGGWSSEGLADAVYNLTGFRLLVEMERVRLDLSTGEARFEGVDISKLDGLIVKKVGARYSPDLLDRLEMLRFLEGGGLRIFSSPTAIMRVINRLSCTITLRLAGIPMPPTTITEDVDEAVCAVEAYGTAVLKPMFSSKAHGMQLIGSGTDARSRLESYRAENSVIYIQKKIEIAGYDLGVVFLGGEYLTTYARCRHSDSWTTSTAYGGRYEAYDPPAEVVELADRAQSQFNLDFTCVDVVETDSGLSVFEVSAFGGFRGVVETSGLDVARLYAEYATERIRG